MGNPPYSGISSNNGEWISRMIDDYKYIDGVHFNERKHWLNDDYVKFIRLGQTFVDKNNEGVLAYINNHSFIDNPTFRGMRWNLMKSFDKIYIIDLHGNSKKKEVCPDGSPDQNIFDIQQGVSINIFVKTGEKAADALAEVYHYDLWGKRQIKYDYLAENKIRSVPFTKVEPTAPFYFFMPKGEDNISKYEQGFRIDALMPMNVMGIATARDKVVIDLDEKALLKRIEKFCDASFSDDDIRKWLFPNKTDGKYLVGDTRGWNLSEARKKIRDNFHKKYVVDLNYRPFDVRRIYYTPDMIDWGRENIMKHFLKGENVGLCLIRISRNDIFSILVTNKITDKTIISSLDNANVFPLYFYHEQADLLGRIRRPNLDTAIITKFAESIELEFESEKSGIADKFAPIDLLDYIYAMLHSPSYRETYKEFLKIDFPRVSYPQGETPTERAANFRRLTSLGSELRQLHLMEHPALSKLITTYPIAGNNTVEKLRWELSDDGETGRVWINPTQYFDSIPLTAWNFYVGGYQPAQKWLKDRQTRTLSFDDIMHYQRIIVALKMTDNLMKEIT